MLKKLSAILTTVFSLGLLVSPAGATTDDGYLTELAAQDAVTDPYAYPIDYIAEADLGAHAQQSIAFLATVTDENKEVVGEGGTSGYTGNRTTLYGKAWIDVDGNKCDQRNDILTRDLVPGTIDYNDEIDGVQGIEEASWGIPSCRNKTVYAGDLIDYYNSSTTVINFERGQSTSSKVQIDHVIPLGYSYTYGGHDLAKRGGKEVMIAFANDPLNLLAVDGPTNGSKSDKGPSQWLPANSDPIFQCRYAIRTSDVLEKYHKYGFSMAQADITALVDSMNTHCPQAAVTPAEPTADPTVEPTVEPTVDPTTEPTVEPTVEPTTEDDASFPDSTPSVGGPADRGTDVDVVVEEADAPDQLRQTGADLAKVVIPVTVIMFILGAAALQMKRQQDDE